VFGTAEATGVIDFRDGELDTGTRFFVLGFTARDGRYFPDFENAVAAYRGVGAGDPIDEAADYSGTFKEASVVDHSTGLRMNLRATDEYTLISPVTTMLAVPGSDQAKLKRQLGITGSTFALANNPDLRTFDPVSAFEAGDEDGARLFAANLRALLLWLGVEQVRTAERFAFSSLFNGQFIEDPPSVLGQGEFMELGVSRCLNQGADEFVFEEAPMLALIDCHLTTRGTGFDGAGVIVTPAKLQAAAHLINTYARAIPVSLDTTSERARYLLGIQGYLDVAIGLVITAQDDSEAMQALQVTEADIRAETEVYSENFQYNSEGLYQPAPDFLVLRGDAPFAFEDSFLISNDVVFSNERFNTRGIDPSTADVFGLRFPGDNELDTIVDNRLLENGRRELTVTARNGFRGNTFFDYEARAQNDETVRTRIYIRVID
jgi:hypothetical protein